MAHKLYTKEWLRNYAQRFTDAQNHCEGEPPRPINTEEVPGVTLYQIGRNSSHSFYVGIREDGTAVRATLGESKDDELVWRFENLQDDEVMTYWGHW